jgi:endonuclease/exonuclease/phosphatase family metal-dependent hydrolase
MEGGVSGTGKVRVLTLNLWGRQGAWDERRSVLADGLEGLRPDLVAFQEAIVRDGYDQVSDLLGPGYHVVHQGVGLLDDGNHGASIASRWPLGEVREIDLHVTPVTADYPCGLLAVEVLMPEPVGSMWFVAYGPWYPWYAERERELQAVAAARFVEGLVDGRRDIRHVVLAGDLNATPDSASVRFWRGLQSLDGTSVCYRDAWEHARTGDPGRTVSSRNPLRSVAGTPLEPGRRIDYIMLRCVEHGPTLDISACECTFDEVVNGVWASDHFGVVADFSAREQDGRPAW